MFRICWKYFVARTRIFLLLLPRFMFLFVPALPSCHLFTNTSQRLILQNLPCYFIQGHAYKMFHSSIFIPPTCFVLTAVLLILLHNKKTYSIRFINEAAQLVYYIHFSALPFTYISLLHVTKPI